MPTPAKPSKNGSQLAAGRARKGLAGKAPVMTAIQTMNAGEKISAIRNGVSKNQLEEIKEQSGLDYDTLSTVLAVSRATLINKKGAEKFDAPTSERILLLADTLAYGQAVFEDGTRFNAWMKSKNKSLGDKPPIEYMDTLYGIQEVRKLIGRIEYGVF